MTIKPEEITARLRRMADVETSVLYSQRTTLIGAADEIERLQAENDGLTKERDAAFAMSRCECGTDEACANLVAKDGEIERLRAENAALRRQLEGNGTTLYAVIADIRQKSGVGVKPMLLELADAIADRIAAARNKALDEAAKIAETMLTYADTTSHADREISAAIRALKDSAP